jgi:hypothetical protein
MHGDHVGWLLVDGKVAFPNAIMRASQQEADFWLSADHMETVPEQMKASSGFEPAIAPCRDKVNISNKGHFFRDNLRAQASAKSINQVTAKSRPVCKTLQIPPPQEFIQFSTCGV